MDNEPADRTPPELQVWMDTEMTFEGTGSPSEHQKIEAALAHLPGVGSLSFVRDRVAIRHDPEVATNAQFLELMSQAGFKVTEVHTASSDPVSDLGEDSGSS